jgi:hypothetical protein
VLSVIFTTLLPSRFIAVFADTQDMLLGSQEQTSVVSSEYVTVGCVNRSIMHGTSVHCGSKPVGVLYTEDLRVGADLLAEYSASIFCQVRMR